ncbi:hypothetical protein CAPTEDRAFT_225531 [Capitella teleta]|uniref:Vesicular inhibitory amino acid transporter n=1 Tax=Capitella teleta TaxID=283909 RepID=R7TAI2_CAPTE|nr:hypothetical protein CAPTEDRAFT_225531 [Capitella teleta]|eukprot:ELT88019.1 hypothetical protein CAPTEDRAFT_225531 [Capitella teleta]
MSGMFSNPLRAIRGLLPSTITSDEKIGFARFHNEVSRSNTETEIHKLSTVNGSLASGQRSGKSSGATTPAARGDPEGTMPDWPEEDEVTEDKIKAIDKISVWQAGWNVTNAIQGMFIVSFPYTVLEGGYAALFFIVLIAYVCCYTGKILVDCLYETNEDGQRRRVRDSYVAIAGYVWGHRVGGRIVYTAQLIELLMTCILYVLLCGMLMRGSFPSAPLSLSCWVMLCSTLLLPCAFLRNLRHVSWLSFWCTVAHLIINAIILVFCFSRAAHWKWSEVHVKVDWWTFPVSLGIITFSYTSQIFLPSLEGCMAQRERFSCMMHWTHTAAALFKAGFAYIGYITFGVATMEVITNNLPNHSMRVIINLILVIKALLSYPLPYFQAADLLEASFFKGRPETPFPSCYEASGSLKTMGLVMRLVLVEVTVVMAIFIPKFALLMGLIGSITGNMLSLIWPCYFHLRIKGATLPFYQKVVNISIIVFALLCSGVGLYSSAHALAQSFKGIDLKPFSHAGAPLHHIDSAAGTEL